jgi:hypothetical protein
MQCKATNKAGEACKKPAVLPEGLCWAHDPKNHAARVRTASRGGASKGNPETQAVKKLMKDLTTKVLAGDLDPKLLYAAVQAQNTLLKAIEIERRLDESDVRAEFEELKRELGIS